MGSRPYLPRTYNGLHVDVTVSLMSLTFSDASAARSAPEVGGDTSMEAVSSQDGRSAATGTRSLLLEQLHVLDQRRISLEGQNRFHFPPPKTIVQLESPPLS